jgi:pSer/pThr/pTyr-binding forkhead associated (FHA) protein
VTSYVLIRTQQAQDVRPLEGDRLSIGADPTSDLLLAGDARISRLHAMLERIGGHWCVRDLDSRNGTFVNGARVVSERPLRSGDEIRVGDTLILYHGDDLGSGPPTQEARRAPHVTEREREVLIALCRPMASGDVFTEPASIREMAEALTVTESAIKQHLANLYDKFDITEDDQHRRVRLANEALHRGVVQIADLRRSPS